MPTQPQFLKTPNAPDTGVTNIHNAASRHWRRWLGLEKRCVIPAATFFEYGQTPDPSKLPCAFRVALKGN